MKQKIFRILANLRFAIFLLLLIAFISIIGTIIEQDESIEVYKLNYPLSNQLFGFLSWNIILKFGLDHLYKTWWFLSIIITFGISLCTCTVLQQLPAFKIARRCQFFRKVLQFRQVPISKVLNQLQISKLLFNLKKKNYLIFQQKNIIYCYQGLIGRVGPIVVHLSMILILVGTIITSIVGFNGQEIVPKTETFHIQNIFSSGKLTKFPQLATRVNDFWILYKNKTIINQFYSNISILDAHGEEINSKTVFVNSPIKYNGIDFYQTNWSLIGLRFQLTRNLFIQYPLIKLNDKVNQIWLTWIPNLDTFNSGLTILIDNLQGYCSLYNKTGEFLGNIELNESLILPYTFIDILNSDGLQIKTDPGIPIIYLGFFFLMVTTLISYKTYSQVWVLKNNSKTFIGGNTNRAIFEFEFEFFKFIK